MDFVFRDWIFAILWRCLGKRMVLTASDDEEYFPGVWDLGVANEDYLYESRIP